MTKLSESVIKAGQDIMSYLFTAQLQYNMGGLGGSKHFDINKFPEEYQDLILDYVEDRIVSVEACYHAMNRAILKEE